MTNYDFTDADGLKKEFKDGRKVSVFNAEAFLLTFQRSKEEEDEPINVESKIVSCRVDDETVLTSIVLSEEAALASAELIMTHLYNQDPAHMTRLWRQVIANQNVLSKEKKSLTE